MTAVTSDRCAKQAQDAVRYLRRACIGRSSALPVSSLGIILGSGLGDFANSLGETKEIPFSSIPHFPKSGVTGHPGALVYGKLAGQPVCCLQGRVHYYEGHSMAAVTFAVRVLALLGIRRLIVTNAAGGLNPKFKPGDLMLLRDHLSSFVPNPLIGRNEGTFGPRFPDMTQCYSPALRRLARKCARKANLSFHEGVYVAVTGPSYETPGEIRMLRKLGAEAIGMSTVPEVIVARHMGIECLGISVITNLAAGISRKPLSHKEVLEAGRRIRPAFCDFLKAICSELLIEASQ